MKLQCEVLVVNRLLATLSMGNVKCRPCKSTLALGREPNGKDFFLIHFSAVNTCGTKYKVTNIEQLFMRFMSEGKVTIRFASPLVDLCVKGDPIQLRLFINALRLAIGGRGSELRDIKLENVAVTANSRTSRTKLTIADRSDFPKHGLPRTLETLIIDGVGLCNFRREILSLRHLKSLDLSNNEIERLPAELGSMPNLKELILSNNNLGGQTFADWKWLTGSEIAKTLSCLDLSDNSLLILPNCISRLNGLNTLKLQKNKLRSLPPGIGRVQSLANLDLSNNSLASLPCSLFNKRLEMLNVTGNPFTPDPPESDSLGCGRHPWTLRRLSGQKVLQQRLAYTNVAIPRTLCTYLDASNYCHCGKPTLDSGCWLRTTSARGRFEVFITSTKTAVTFDIYPCSSVCASEIRYRF